MLPLSLTTSFQITICGRKQTHQGIRSGGVSSYHWDTGLGAEVVSLKKSTDSWEGRHDNIVLSALRLGRAANHSAIVQLLSHRNVVNMFWCLSYIAGS